LANKTSQHILNTSATLLGFCLFIVTPVHFTEKKENSLIDEITSVIALLPSISSVFSFISIRTENSKKEYLFEKIADYFFIVALLGIIIIILFIILNFRN
jgi:hypothetical protein